MMANRLRQTTTTIYLVTNLVSVTVAVIINSFFVDIFIVLCVSWLINMKSVLVLRDTSETD